MMPTINSTTVVAIEGDLPPGSCGWAGCHSELPTSRGDCRDVCWSLSETVRGDAGGGNLTHHTGDTTTRHHSADMQSHLQLYSV